MISALYLDESGTFQETSTDSAERAEAEASPRRFPSQLAGFLAPEGGLSEQKAGAILAGALRETGREYTGEFHATEQRLSRNEYSRMVRALVRGLRRHGLQPVRLVNRERVSYGDRVANYTHCFAEIIQRSAEQKLREGVPQLALDLTTGIVLLAKDDDGMSLLLAEEYRSRLQEYVAFAAVRRGLALESAGWRVAGFRTASARRRPQLQICDLLSHASHANYKRCNSEAKQALREAFGPYDFSLSSALFLDRCDELCAEGSFGLAVRVLAEALVPGDKGKTFAEGARERLDAVIGQLGSMPALGRDMQLRALTDWLELLVASRQSLPVGLRVAQWLIENVDRPLERHVEQGDQRAVDWFRFAIRRWALTACNHLGLLDEGNALSANLDRFAPSLAGRWEHASLLMDGMVTQAVHATDCLELEMVASRMRLVVDYYGELSELFHVAFPSVFPERVRSDSRGKALGTWLQAEIGLCARDPERLDAARGISDEAIAEFGAESERRRQYQYRCQLETVAGKFEEAAGYLAKGLGTDDASHGGMAGGIGAEEGPAQGFVLLHWLNLGTAELAAGAELGKEFSAALRRSGLLGGAWCTGKFKYYPVHGILRRVAKFHAVEGYRDESLSALGLLRELEEQGPEAPVLRLVVVAAYLEVAALLMPMHRQHAHRLLDNPAKGRPGARQMLAKVAKDTKAFSGLQSLGGSLGGVVEQAVQPEADPDASSKSLLGGAALVPY